VEGIHGWGSGGSPRTKFTKLIILKSRGFDLWPEHVIVMVIIRFN